MPRNYKISSNGTGSAFLVKCKDGSWSGWYHSRQEARDAGKANCPNKNFDIHEIKPSTSYLNNTYDDIALVDYNGNQISFSAAQIAEKYIMNYLGHPTGESLNDVDIVITALKLWGVYAGGTTESAILADHNMSQSVYDRIKNNCMNIDLKINDDDSLEWTEYC